MSIEMKGRRSVMVFLIGLLSASYAIAGLLSQDETPGERFRKAIKREAEYCATHKIKPANHRCDITKLQPADPLATEEGRFAHSLKIPNPVPADSGYMPGMTPEQYFEHLCKAEAGEFIYKTVENVEGLYMMRPRKEATDDELSHLYALEDPYGHTNGEATMGEYDFVSPDRYSYLERPTQSPRSGEITRRHGGDRTDQHKQEGYERFTGYDSRHLESMKRESAKSLRSRYGFTWRGITRPHERELGIVGGELIVVDLETKEVLGVRRGYIRSGNSKNQTGIWWLTGQSCPTYGYRGGRNKDFDLSYWFIGKVLKPKNYEQSFKELINGQ
ncbi:MAG: hypothetical protein NW703_16420 [Nitrospiraceae bacterium]